MLTYATKFREDVKDMKNEGVFVIILTQTKIKVASGSKYMFLYIVLLCMNLINNSSFRAMANFDIKLIAWFKAVNG